MEYRTRMEAKLNKLAVDLTKARVSSLHEKITKEQNYSNV